jgi:histidine phosphotransferase ChpT
MSDAATLSALIGSRICHDLISPIGAIGNGLELMQLGGAAGPEVALVSESAGNANARIRFFRVAFGLAAADQRVSQAEVVRILQDLWRGHRLRIDWRVSGDQTRPEVKLAFLLLLCVEHALPWGGQVTITGEAGRWRILAEADKLRVADPLWSMVTAGKAVEGPLGPAEVQFALLQEELAARGYRLDAAICATSIALRFGAGG